MICGVERTELQEQRDQQKEQQGEQRKSRRYRGWVKGQSGNPAGRRPGSLNQTTLEIKAAAKALIEDPEYRISLRQRLVAGKAPHMEALLHHYAYGQPSSKVELTERHEVIMMTRQLGTDPLAALPPAFPEVAES